MLHALFSTIKEKPPLILVTSAYALILAFYILYGDTMFLIEGLSGYYHNAIDMPLLAFIIALLCLAAGTGLFLGKTYSRALFYVIIPCASIAMASVYPWKYWRDDVPSNMSMIFVYVPLVFLLSRMPYFKKSETAKNGWISNGGALLLACALFMFVMRYTVGMFISPKGHDFVSIMEAKSLYVQHLAVCDVLLWHYLPGAVFILNPFRFIWKAGKFMVQKIKTQDIQKTQN